MIWRFASGLSALETAMAVPRYEELASYEVNDKGTIRLPLTRPAPPALIAGIACFRAMEIREKGRRARKTARGGTK
jgi:hypothetical protein